MNFIALGSALPSSAVWCCSAVDSSPAWMRRARSTSCAALRSGTLRISWRYMRTGSLVGAGRRSASIRTCVAASVSSPGTSMTSTPSAVRCSCTCVRNSSTCSCVKSSTGTASRRSSEVTKPRSRPFATSCSLTSSRLSGSASRAGTLTVRPGGYLSRPRQCTEAGSRGPLLQSTQRAVDLYQPTEQLVVVTIGRRVHPLELAADRIALRLEHERAEAIDDGLGVRGRRFALERFDDQRGDLRGTIDVVAAHDLPGIPLDVAERDEQGALLRCREVRLVDRRGEVGTEVAAR